MVAFTSVLAILATLAATSTHVSANSGGAIHDLLARQSAFDPSMIPDQCRSQCSDLAKSFASGNCSDLDCMCDSSTAKDMISCLKCGVDAVGADTAQTWYDDYSNACKSVGKTVPSFSASAKDNGASRVHLAGAGLAGAVGVGLLLVA